jgi:hypothetical protein
MALPTRRGNEGSWRSSEVEAPASGFPTNSSSNGEAERPRRSAQGASLGLRSSGASSALPPRPHGPLERLLEGLVLTSNKGTRVPWHVLTARRRAAPTSSERSGITKPPRQNARAHPAAQPDELRVGNCAAATKGSWLLAPEKCDHATFSTSPEQSL